MSEDYEGIGDTAAFFGLLATIAILAIGATLASYFP